MRYVVTAFCTRPWCRVKEFTELRQNISFADGDGQERTIRHIRCPRCKAQATITKKQEIA